MSDRVEVRFDGKTDAVTAYVCGARGRSAVKSGLPVLFDFDPR